ncbi:WD repeat domain phosphoinositide-interacting protein 2 [Sciurus carolinensis]|uniref:WD repeat domain phosphoinositide-interacting protein 2 n=1 Tax=Sciurus carolinensis TaxID=30640 RepID=A0AA41MU00_SCICA|nr:WD repeat domain phosphoinositide-interacting protein 2 [Sciurus carolinensis]
MNLSNQSCCEAGAGQLLFANFNQGNPAVKETARTATWVACSSLRNTETVHIFKLETVKEKPPEEPTTWTGYFGKVLMVSTSYLLFQVTEMRAFAIIHLPFSGHKNICSLATIQKISLLVGASDCYLYMYNLDSQEGSECVLMQQHRLDGSMETISEIIDSACHDCPLITQMYGAAATKSAYMPWSPTRLGKGQDTNLEAYTDDLGVMGGACLKDETSALCLDRDSEHPTMILQTD